MLAWLKVSYDDSIDLSHCPLTAGCPTGLQHQELHLRLEQRDQPGRPAGLLQAGSDAQLAEAEPQQWDGEREESHGDR